MEANQAHPIPRVQVVAIECKPKPRMTRADKWSKRPAVQEYWEFKRELNELGIALPESGARVTFGMKMPASWPKYRKVEMLGKPHQQTPDLDNLVKGLCDAVFEDDKVFWSGYFEKVWATEPYIRIEV